MARVPSAKPTDLATILVNGTGWQVDQIENIFTLDYQENSTDVVQFGYTQEELTLIDARLPLLLVSAEAHCGSRSDMQAALRASHQLWTTKVWALLRPNRPVHFVHTINTVRALDATRVGVSYSYAKALPGSTRELPLVKNNYVIAVNTPIPLAVLEDCFPGFQKSYTIAQGLDLSPVETAVYCMQQVGFLTNTHAVSPLNLPNDLLF